MLAVGQLPAGRRPGRCAAGAEIPDWFMTFCPLSMEKHLLTCSRRHLQPNPKYP